MNQDELSLCQTHFGRICRRSFRRVWWLFVAILCTSTNAWAQAKTFYLDRLQIGGAPADGVAVWNPEINGTRAFIQAAPGVALRPLRTEHIVNNAADVAVFQGDPVKHQFIVYATVGAEIKDWLLFSATLPMLLSQDGLPTYRPNLGYNDAVTLEPGSVYDLRLEGRIKVLENAKTFRLGMRAALFLPIGDEASYAGDTSFWGQIGVAADAQFKRASGTLNLGISLRPDAHLNAFRVGNEFNYALGVYVPLAEGRVRLGAELFGSVGITGETSDSEKNAPLESSLSIRYARGKKKLRGWVGLAAGPRLTSGYAPDFRIVGFAGIAIPPDAEQIVNQRPQFDTDADGYPDDADGCPRAPEDGIRPGDGCPEVKKNRDRDRDGLEDAVDSCPDNPEDKDEIDDQDGCPEEDADGDGVLDIADKCPKEPGVSGGDPDKEGCPQFIERVDTTIEIRQQIEFAFDTTRIEPRSRPILAEVAQTLRKNPNLRISIEGHTDEVGTDEYNEQLSQARAKAVMEHLVSLGVDRQRLSIQWFGKTKPIVQDESEEGRAKNRRVEFRVVP